MILQIEQLCSSFLHRPVPASGAAHA
jgi:hypothetical protein